jgi:hypothetical protein
MFFMKRTAAKRPREERIRLRLECIRMAQSLLPREKLPRSPRWRPTPGAAPGEVMKLARDLYCWMADERRQPGRKLNNDEKLIRKMLALADRELYREFKRKSAASWQAHLKQERERLKRADRWKLQSAAAAARPRAVPSTALEKIPSDPS